VGRTGSGVRVSVRFLQKIPAGFCPTMSYGSRKRRLWPRGLCPGGWPLRCITSRPSQTLRRRLVRTTDAAVSARLHARRRPSRLCFSQFATRTVDNTVDLYAAKPDIRTESRFLPTPPAYSTFPSGGGFVGISPYRFAWLPDGEKNSRICLFVLTWSTNVTDGRTDGQTPDDGIGRAYA